MGDELQGGLSALEEIDLVTAVGGEFGSGLVAKWITCRRQRDGAARSIVPVGSPTIAVTIPSRRLVGPDSVVG